MLTLHYIYCVFLSLTEMYQYRLRFHKIICKSSLEEFSLFFLNCCWLSNYPLSALLVVANTACDPVIEEHFRRSLGNNYKESEAVSNSVSITGSVDDHFAKALGDTWLQIKARGGGHPTPEADL